MIILKSKIFTIRGIQVMLDSDLAELYGVETGVLNHQVKRNIERFPSDLCFKYLLKNTMTWNAKLAYQVWNHMAVEDIALCFYRAWGIIVIGCYSYGYFCKSKYFDNEGFCCNAPFYNW